MGLQQREYKSQSRSQFYFSFLPELVWSHCILPLGSLRFSHILATPATLLPRQPSAKSFPVSLLHHLSQTAWMPSGLGAFQLAILAIVVSQHSSRGSSSGGLLMAAFLAALLHFLRAPASLSLDFPDELFKVCSLLP